MFLLAGSNALVEQPAAERWLGSVEPLECTARPLDLEPTGLTADTAAELLIASARGLQSSAPSPAAYRRYLNALVRVMVAGLASTGPSHAVSRPQA